MHTLLFILFGIWGGIITVWQGLLLAQFLLRRHGFILESGDAPPSPGLTEAVCIVVPACNEADNLAACLDRVLAQDYPHLTVLVIDDRSQDDTVHIAEAYAARDPRVRIERITALPAGWLGKSHALWAGTREAKADWLLFLDADCLLEPGAVRVALHEARRRKVELLSIWPRQTPGTFWEHMTIPLCAGIIALWFGSARVNRRGSAQAFANGQFLLIARRAYEQIDGHRGVRNALIEDIPLARRAKGEGISCWVTSGRSIASVRMYKDYAAIRDGWARIYAGVLGGPLRIGLSILWLASGSLWPHIALVLTACLLVGAARAGHAAGPVLRLAAAMSVSHLLLVYVVSYRFWGLGDCRRRYLWLYPISTLVVMRILWKSWWWTSVRRSVPWRGTSYPIDSRGFIQLPVN